MIPTTIDVRERLRLRVCKTEKFKAESLSVSMALPLSKDRYLTTLLLAVLGRGCERYPTQAQINRRLDYLFGAEISFRDYALGDSQVIGLCADVVSAAYLPEQGSSVLAETLALMREILFHPLLDGQGLLDAKYVESEKKLQCDAIRAKRNSPRAYALERCLAQTYEGRVQGASRLGTVEEVEAVTPEVLTAHWRSLIGRIRMECCYIGGCEGEQIARVLEDVLGEELVAPVPQATPRVFAEPLSERSLTRFEESLPVSQGQLVMSFRFPTVLSGRRLFVAELLYGLLGASPVSKLFVNVRERLGLCYFCNARIERYTGVAIVSCGLDAENRELAEREILTQIDALARGEITDTEWEAARTMLSDNLGQMQDAPSAIDRFYFNCALSGMDYTVDAWRDELLSVTREEVAALAGEMTADTVFFLHPTRGEEADDEED